MPPCGAMTTSCSEDNMKPNEIENLKTVLVSARAKAIEAIVGVEDMLGTCNFDSPVLHVPRKNKKVEDAIKAVGLDFWHHPRRKGYVLSIGVGGQAHTRTRGAEVFQKVLEEAGFDVGMWYQMD